MHGICSLFTNKTAKEKGENDAQAGTEGRPKEEKRGPHKASRQFLETKLAHLRQKHEVLGSTPSVCGVFFFTPWICGVLSRQAA